MKFYLYLYYYDSALYWCHSLVWLSIPLEGANVVKETWLNIHWWQQLLPNKTLKFICYLSLYWTASMSRNITLEKHSKAKRLGSSHSPAPQFLEGPLNSGKVSVPPKNGPFEGVKKFFGPPKKIPPGKWMWHVLFAKKLKKIRQIWPRRSLKHFTAAYRGFPPCTQSQPPINRETGYSNVLQRIRYFMLPWPWL